MDVPPSCDTAAEGGGDKEPEEWQHGREAGGDEVERGFEDHEEEEILGQG